MDQASRRRAASESIITNPPWTLAPSDRRGFSSSDAGTLRHRSAKGKMPSGSSAGPFKVELPARVK